MHHCSHNRFSAEGRSMWSFSMNRSKSNMHPAQMQHPEMVPGFWDTRAGVEKLLEIIMDGMYLRHVWTATSYFIFNLVKYYMDRQPSKDYRMETPTFQQCLRVCKMYPTFFSNFSMQHPDEQWDLMAEAMPLVQALENSINENWYEGDYSKMFIQDEIMHIILKAPSHSPPTTSDIEEMVRLQFWLHPYAKTYIGTPHIPTHLQVRTVLEQVPGIYQCTGPSGIQTWGIH